MILVTVGTEQFPFNRLMEWTEAAIEYGILREEVVVQAGSCTVTPTGAEVHAILPEDRFQQLVQSARIVISHCGEGSYLLLSQLRVPFILVPRSARFGEHVDDHQVEMATALEDLGCAIARSPIELISHLTRPILPTAIPSISNSANRICQMLQQQFPFDSDRQVAEDISAVPIRD